MIVWLPFENTYEWDPLDSQDFPGPLIALWCSCGAGWLAGDDLIDTQQEFTRWERYHAPHAQQCATCKRRAGQWLHGDALECCLASALGEWRSSGPRFWGVWQPPHYGHSYSLK